MWSVHKDRPTFIYAKLERSLSCPEQAQRSGLTKDERRLRIAGETKAL